MHRNSRIRDARSQNTHLHGVEQLLNYSSLLPFISFSRALARSSFSLLSLSLCRSTYVNFHKYFLHNAPYPWNDLWPKPRGQRERNERQSLRLNYTLLPSSLYLSPPRFLNLSPRNRCFQQPSRPPLSFPIQAWNTRAITDYRFVRLFIRDTFWYNLSYSWIIGYFTGGGGICLNILSIDNRNIEEIILPYSREGSNLFFHNKLGHRRFHS